MIPAEDLDEDRPKPLYRDEVEAPVADTADAADAADKPTRPITFTQRRPRTTDDEDATTILPRTSSIRRTAEVEQFDDDDDDRRPMNSRLRTALLIGAVAAVVVIGLAVFYAVGGVGQPPAVAPSAATSIPGSTNPSSTASSPGVGELLADNSMISPQNSDQIAAKRGWKVASTDPGTAEDAAQPACFTAEPVEGQPAPQQKLLRLLTSTGKNAPGILHQATAYASPEEAAQAYAVASKTLGSCTVVGSYLVQGQSVSGLGDQAVGVVAASVVDGTTQLHTVMVNRTGQVMNIVDAVQPEVALNPSGVATALAAVTKIQCGPAAGTCPVKPTVKNGPPPLGGDEPGFLAYGDLPPAGKTPGAWGATPNELPKGDFAGSGCETINWSTLSTESTTSRTYIPEDASSSFFGLNDIVVTMKDEATAKKLVEKVKSDLDSCEKRKLTAQVSVPAKVASVGAQSSPVTGWTAEVAQKSVEGTKKYRVGIVSAGSKVAYTFLNPQNGFDFTPQQWNVVAVRAGERATQVN